jgi:hypothetical protein
MSLNRIGIRRSAGNNRTGSEVRQADEQPARSAFRWRFGCGAPSRLLAVARFHPWLIDVAGCRRKGPVVGWWLASPGAVSGLPPGARRPTRSVAGVAPGAEPLAGGEATEVPSRPGHLALREDGLLEHLGLARPGYPPQLPGRLGQPNRQTAPLRSGPVDDLQRPLYVPPADRGPAQELPAEPRPCSLLEGRATASGLLRSRTSSAHHPSAYGEARRYEVLRTSSLTSERQSGETGCGLPDRVAMSVKVSADSH